MRKIAGIFVIVGNCNAHKYFAKERHGERNRNYGMDTVGPNVEKLSYSNLQYPVAISVSRIWI
jgi:hypothetical protein